MPVVCCYYCCLWNIGLLVTRSGGCKLSAPAFCNNPSYLLHNWILFVFTHLWGISMCFLHHPTTQGLTTTINECHSVSIGMNVDSEQRLRCIVCGVRWAEPMTYVCEDEKCFEIFMDYQSKGRLKELLNDLEDEKEEHNR